MRRTSSPSRQAFTLIELLVVISIIGVLAALTAGAVFRLRGAQSVNNTEATLSKIHLRMAARWSAIIDQAKKDVPTLLIDRCGGDKDRATALWTQAVLKNEFPMTVAEANAIVSFGSDPTLTLRPRKIFTTVPAFSPANPAAESAALIYLAISQAGNKGVNAGMDGLEGQTAAIPISATPGAATVTVFKDSWGNPITFMRHASGGEINGPPYTRAGTVKVAGTYTLTVNNMLDPLAKLSTWSPPVPAMNDNPWLYLKTLDTSSMPLNNYTYMHNQLRMGGLPTTGFASFPDIAYGNNTIPTVISYGPGYKYPAAFPAWNNDNNLLSYRLRKEGDRGN
jgi:prepilin-type N-terminal cleavage/methylation domain-containing protein